MSHSLTAAGVALGLATCLAACGGSAKPVAGGRGSGHANQQLLMARCLRAHGVTNFPDPTQGPGGSGFSITMTPGSSVVTIDGTNFSGPVFTSAEKACKLLGGGTAPPPITERQKQQLVSFARCMRTHGIKDWSDPTFPPGGGIANGGPANRAEVNTPAAQRAVKTCNRINRL